MMHIIVGLLFGLKIEKIFLSKVTIKNIHGFVMFGDDGLAKSHFSEFFVSFSPFLILLSSISLLFVSLNTIPFFIYLLLTLKINIPSKEDFIKFFFYNELKKIHNIFDIDDEKLDDILTIEDDFFELTLKEIINKDLKNKTKEKLSKF